VSAVTPGEVATTMPPEVTRALALRYDLGGIGWLGLAIGFLGSAAAEEVVLRGYLLTRLARWTASGPMAVVITAAVFASYHVYQGIEALIPVFTSGLLFGAAALWLWNLWPLIVAHAATNVLVTLVWY